MAHPRSTPGSTFRPARTGRWLLTRALPGALLLAAALPASADTLWIASGGGNPVRRENVRVTKIENGNVFFDTTQGAAPPRPLADVRRMEIPGEVPLNAAEEAFEKNDFATAAQQYRRAMDVSQKPFVKARAIARLAEAAAKTGDFAAAVSAWLQTVPGLDVATAKTNKPATTGIKPDALNAGAAELERAGAAGRLNPEQRLVVQTFAVEAYQAAGNTAKAQELLNKLNPGGAAAAAPGNPAAAPGAVAARAGTPGVGGDLVLAQSKQALAARDWQRAIDLIERNRAGFTQPDNQAEALYNLAVAREGLAGNDPAKLQDAAIAYMRVVAHFGDKPVNGVNVHGALWKVATIQEQLKNTNEALQIYNQLANDVKLKNTQLQAAAAKKVAELKRG